MTYNLTPILQYGPFAVLWMMALVQMYKAMWSSDERVYFKRQFIRTLKSQQRKVVREEESKVAVLFRESGLSWLDDARWLLVRVFLLAVGTVWLVALGEYMWAILYFVGMYIATELTFKFSVAYQLLQMRKRGIYRKKELELFTLFALLKTDLLASSNEQINVYHLIQENLPYFEQINSLLVRFLSIWKRSPQMAGSVFHKELEGETAQFLGDVLGKLHKLNRADALALLEEQGEVFTFKRSELAVQRADVQRKVYFIFFMISALVGIFWFMWFCYSMIAESINF